MPDVRVVFHMHHAPPLLRRRVQDAESTRPLFDEAAGRAAVDRLGLTCYDPALDLLAGLARSGLRMGLAVSGCTIEQLAGHAPRTLERLRRLTADPNVELVGQTYRQSLAELADIEEFIAQVERHRRAIDHYFGRVTGPLFRATDLHHSPLHAPLLRRLGFAGTLFRLEHGATLPANRAHASAVDPAFALLPRHERLSDDLMVRFSQRSWDRWPLTADRFAGWVAASPGDSVLLDLGITMLGAANPAGSGIFEFMRHLPDALRRCGVTVVAPSEGLTVDPLQGRSGWSDRTAADATAIASAMPEDRLGRHALRRLYSLRQPARECGRDIAETWSRLTCADYLRPMAPGADHTGPYRSRFDAYMSFMNVLDEIEAAIAKRKADRAPGITVEPRSTSLRRRLPAGLSLEGSRARRTATQRRIESGNHVRVSRH